MLSAGITYDPRNELLLTSRNFAFVLAVQKVSEVRRSELVRCKPLLLRAGQRLEQQSALLGAQSDVYRLRLARRRVLRSGLALS